MTARSSRHHGGRGERRGLGVGHVFEQVAGLAAKLTANGTERLERDTLLAWPHVVQVVDRGVCHAGPPRQIRLGYALLFQDLWKSAYDSQLSLLLYVALIIAYTVQLVKYRILKLAYTARLGLDRMGRVVYND